MKAKSSQKLKKMSAVITRADGTKENLGVLVGGHWWERIACRIRVWHFNRITRGRTK
jgi:hypothetical protein